MKVAFISLGCDKNLTDSEHMLYLLHKDNIEISSEEDADVIVVNSCCFIADSLEESIDNIIAAGELKKKGKLSGLVLSGCMSERYKDEIREELPEVDTIVGTNSYDNIVEAVKAAYNHEKKEYFKSHIGIPNICGRISTTGLPYNFVKIAEGCNKFCTYCVIPSIRGRFRSVPMEMVLHEINQLADDGITEINLVAQETTLYGIDLYGKKMLPTLLSEIEKIKYIKSIRLLYCYPETIDEELVYEMARNKKVLHYIDMPIQHCNDLILHRMNRKATKQLILDKIKLLRNKIPDIAIRTTLITGFPGETDEMHEEMKEFIKQVKFDRLGVFTYSREKNTPAYNFPNQVDEEVKKKRKDELMRLQKTISLMKNRESVGNVVSTFVEGYVPEKKIYVGRTYKDAPNVDNYIFFKSDIDLMSGSIVDVKINDFKEYDLYGELVE